MYPHRLRFWFGVRPACLSAIALLFGGCAQVYDVKVDALRDPEVPAGHSYRIIVKDHGHERDDANQQRAAALVGKALAGHGMYEAEDPEDADVSVEVNYEVGPQRNVPRVVPAMNEVVLRDRFGTPIPLAGSSGDTVVVDTVYEKKLTIVARENRRSSDGRERPPREIWRVEVRVDDRKDKVDEVLPVLVGAAVDHIGTDSTTARSKRLSDDSEPVTFVKGGS